MRNRIQVIDAFRGFALAGIVFVHFVERYAGAPLPADAVSDLTGGLVNNLVSGFVQFFLVGKFFALFSFLFGLSFYLQMKRGEDHSGSYALTFLWRIILLGGIGYCHHLFYRGDILTIYALLALLLIPFYKVPNRWVLIISTLLILGLGRFTVFVLNQFDPIFGEEILGPESESVAIYWNLLQNGTWWEVAKNNATFGMIGKLDFQFSTFNRGYLTFGFFLLGLFVGRIGLFANILGYKPKIKRTIWVSIGIMVLSIMGMLLSFMNANAGVDLNNVRAMIGMNFYDLFNVSLTIIITGCFLLLWLKPKWMERLQQFSAYGRMALTNYVMQSIIGCLLLYGYGLGMIDVLPTYALALIGILIIILQVWISRIWLQRYRFGPLEWLWRSATIRKWQPFKKI